MHRLLLIDGNSILFRFFYGIGENAHIKLFEYIIRLIQRLHVQYCAIMFDISKSTLRVGLYNKYKANRKQIDPMLVYEQEQFKQLCIKHDLTIIEEHGYEADDVIASYISYYQDQCDEIIIGSSDKDLMILMNEKVKIFDFSKKRYLTLDDIYNKFHVNTTKRVQLIHAIAGDAADNIPGAYGIGLKGASKISMSHDDPNITLDDVYASVASGGIITDKLSKLLLDSKDTVYLSYQLVELDHSVPIRYEALQQINIAHIY